MRDAPGSGVQGRGVSSRGAHVRGDRVRDAQRARVYAWEDRVVAPLAPGMVGFDAAQGMVDAIWAESGLRFPPKVARLPARATRTVARADRLTVELPAEIACWCLLHELAHAMSATHDGAGDGHGPVFVGLYVDLLVRYLRLDRARLLESLRAAGIRVAPDARPVFLTGPSS